MTQGKIGLAGLLVALALVLAACGGAGGSGAQQDDAPRANVQDGQQNGGKQDMGHGDMGHGDMGHGQAGGEEMARQMLEDESGKYSDRRFIDMMVPHHEGAISMAEVALERSDREEILGLSRDIVRTQEAEIEELKDIKEQEFGTSEIPGNMGGDGMRGMGMMTDPQQLAQADPFDKAFIDNMIPHHESAIDMASVVLEESENGRLRQLARDIVEAQKREIIQMERWRKEWYPEG